MASATQHTFRVTWWRTALSRLDFAETFVRRSILNGVHSLRLYQDFKRQKQILLLKEITEILARGPATCRVVGGVAYDGLQGRFTTIHKDIDLAVMETDFQALLNLLKSSGFTLSKRSPYTAVARRDGQHVDIFLWTDLRDGRIQHVTADKVLRIPMDFLTDRQHVQLAGIAFPVPSTRYMSCILPLVGNPDHRAFLQSLPAGPLHHSITKQTVQISLEATVHEFSREP